MNAFLIRKFIKNYKNTEDPAVRESYGKLAGIVGIASNALLCTLKILTGILFHSVAILADGINNLADASSSLITLIGFRMAARPADEDHPYGHARIEYITGLIVSMLIIVLGLQLLATSFEKVRYPDPVEFSYLTIVVLAAAIAIKIWQAMFNWKMGDIINSSALKATAADSRNDVISTAAVLISILAGKLFGIQLDGIMGVFVALFIIYSGFMLVKETADPLLGQAPDPALVQAIHDRIAMHPQALGIHDLVVHNYGPGRIFASVHVEVDAYGNLVESHDVIDNIERDISEELHLHLVVHMDPIDTKDPLTTKAGNHLQQVIDSIDGLLNAHDLRVVAGVTHHNLIFDIVAAQNCPYSDSEIKQLVTEGLRKYDPMYRTVITVDRNYT